MEFINLSISNSTAIGALEAALAAKFNSKGVVLLTCSLRNVLVCSEVQEHIVAAIIPSIFDWGVKDTLKLGHR